MRNKIKSIIIKNPEIFALFLVIIITIISTNYYNFNKKKTINEYKNLISNVYLKKSIENLFDNLEPKFKKINHQIISGETFDTALRQYSVDEAQIKEIKKKLSKKINLNKLVAGQKIQFTIDQKKNLIKSFKFQVSTTEIIYLTRDTKTDEFNQKILISQLNKKILYRENIILDSLYRSASKEKIPANIIIEFSEDIWFSS
tara:strand:- start:274 stop:876 length:603 start_codon:yes stop_codon:yes gene_type:complete